MKTKDILLLGALGVAAYFFLGKKKDELGDALGSAVSDVQKGLATPGGLLGAQSATDIGYQVQAALTSPEAIGVGGQTVQAVKTLTGQQSILAPGAASVLANVAYLNAISGQEIIRTTVQPTASGSGIIKLTPTAGALNVPGNQAIANAVRAATAPTYGMSNVSGGVTVFNVTPQGTSPTTTLTTPTAIASALARGLI